MRTPIVAGNWKMNTTVDEAIALVECMVPELRRLVAVERVVCPPFVSLVPVRKRLRETGVLLGAQNMFYEDKGAYTGEVSPVMLKGLADYVILGHSERRQYFGETDEIVNRKVRAALRHELRPILCVGETLEERERGETRHVVERQVRGALADLREAPGLVVAYEPVWAIGTGRQPTPEDAGEVIAFIRSVLAECLGPDAARSTRIQYGGSVTPENFPPFIAHPEIDGALVGGASLKAESFVALVRQAAEAKGG
ncbi:MAG TPA: triose-phosphate isomerase [Chloroflexota bacterium]